MHSLLADLEILVSEISLLIEKVVDGLDALDVQIHRREEDLGG